MDKLKKSYFKVCMPVGHTCIEWLFFNEVIHVLQGNIIEIRN